MAIRLHLLHRVTVWVQGHEHGRDGREALHLVQLIYRLWGRHTHGGATWGDRV